VPATGTPGENLRDLRGIHVSGDDSRRLDHFVIERVDVHDVTGEVNWISGSVSDNAPGIHFKTGWDGSKKTGGIIFDTTVPDITAPPATPTVLNDIEVRHSTVRNTSFAGIVVKQYTGDGKDANGNTIATPTGWGTRTSAADTTFTPHTKVTIRDNYITQAGTAYGCNGIYLTNVRGALVDHNVVDATGTSGIETYYSDDVVIQRNEVYRTQAKAGGADSNGIDADKGTTRVVIQYNFVHDNGDGFLLCQFAFGDVVVRYNIVSGNSRYPIYLHSDK
ncbi:right-handed parallel beta-helix repeat-containing protein, partial [Streptomyces sp. 2MCAF27]